MKLKLIKKGISFIKIAIKNNVDSAINAYRTEKNRANNNLADLAKPAFKPGIKIAQHFEAELLRFADHFKTRRVYVVQWHKDENFRIDFYYKFFKYEDRAIAYDIARHYHAHVQIFDFKNLIDKPLEYIASIPSPNRREAIELWKTFNTCCACHSETERCENVLFRGKKDRMCKHCVDKFAQWPTKGG